MATKAEYQRRYYEANKESLNAYRKAYYEAHRDEILAKNKVRDAAALAADPERFKAIRNALTSEWAKKNPKKRREVGRAWRRRNTDYMRAKQREWYANPDNRAHAAALRRDATRRLRLEMIAAYGGECVCCGVSDEPFLSLDHVNRDGRQHSESLTGMVGSPRRTALIYKDLKRRGWPQDAYRLLCMSCNFATRYGDPCPHVVRQADEMLAGVLCS